MSGPLSMEFILFLGMFGLVVVLIADTLPRRPSAPPDWDPYSWRLWQQRTWPREPLAREFLSASVTMLVTGARHTRDLLARTFDVTAGHLQGLVRVVVAAQAFIAPRRWQHSSGAFHASLPHSFKWRPHARGARPARAHAHRS